MATVSKEIAEEIIAKNGYYPGDPRVSNVLTYIGGDGKLNYAIIYNPADAIAYYNSPYCGNVKTIWSSIWSDK